MTIPREPYTSADIERIKANYDEEVDTYRLLATIDWMQDELRDGRAEVERLRTAGDAMAEAVDEQGHYLSAGLSRRCADCDKPSPITTNAWDEHYSDCPVLTRRATLEAWCKATEAC